MKNTFLIFAVVYIIALMTSCTTSKHSNSNGLVKHGCRGIKALPGRH
jgi:hypothetical protein